MKNTPIQDALHLANPLRFTRWAKKTLPFAAALFLALLALGLFLALTSPPDYQQGEAVRIMFVHVPAAWMAMLIYAFMAVASACALIFRTPMSDIAAQSAAPIGAAFTFLALATGALWGQPIWGTWWVWDARLTSVLILLFLYLGHIALRRAMDHAPRADRAAAILTLAGAVNLPIIKFSVDWAQTLHQPASVLRAGGPHLDRVFLEPLLLMGAAYAALFLTLLLMQMQADLLRRRNEWAAEMADR